MRSYFKRRVLRTALFLAAGATLVVLSCLVCLVFGLLPERFNGLLLLTEEIEGAYASIISVIAIIVLAFDGDVR